MSDIIVGENATSYVDVNGELVMLSTFLRGEGSGDAAILLTPAKTRALAAALVAAAKLAEEQADFGLGLTR